MPFSASIIERNFAYVPDKILKLGGAAWLRPLGGPALTAPWERIRLGVLCAATPFNISSISDTLFLFGICSGTANPGSAFLTDNFIGASMIGAETTAATRVLTYTAGSGNPYYAATVGRGFRKASYTTNTTTANFSTGWLVPLVGYGDYSSGNVAFYARRTPVIIDITKTPGGGGGVTFTVYCNTTPATAQAFDFRPDHLFEALDQPGTPTLRGVALTAVVSSTALNISDLGGQLDTFEIFWSNSTYPLEISAVGASIIRPLSYSGIAASDSADESFQEYDAGTVSTSMLSGGSGWSAAWTGPVRDVISYGSFQADTNYAPQIYAEYAGTTVSADEPFQHYGIGTVNYGSNIALGSFWSAAPTLNSGNTNLEIQVYAELAGTNLSPYDLFTSYATNTTNNGTTDTFGGGAYWETAGTAYSYGSFLYTGTTIPNFGPIATAALVGTTYSACDDFNNYAAGTVDSNVTVNAGSYWSGNGIVTVFNYP